MLGGLELGGVRDAVVFGDQVGVDPAPPPPDGPVSLVLAEDQVERGEALEVAGHRGLHFPVLATRSPMVRP